MFAYPRLHRRVRFPARLHRPGHPRYAGPAPARIRLPAAASPARARLTTSPHARSRVRLSGLVRSTTGAGPRFTGGSLYYYPGFNGGVKEDVVKFSTDYAHFISRPYGLEAVMRVRASKGADAVRAAAGPRPRRIPDTGLCLRRGRVPCVAPLDGPPLGIRMTGYHGHFFIRSMDLLALPSVSPDNSYGYQVALDEPIQGNVACFQAGLLYTTSFGNGSCSVVARPRPVLRRAARSVDTKTAALGPDGRATSRGAGVPRRTSDPRAHARASGHERSGRPLQLGVGASDDQFAGQDGCAAGPGRNPS